MKYNIIALIVSIILLIGNSWFIFVLTHYIRDKLNKSNKSILEVLQDIGSEYIE